MAGSTPSASHYHTKTVNGPQIEKICFIHRQITKLQQ